MLVTISATAVKHSLQSAGVAMAGSATSPAAQAALHHAAVHGYQMAVRVGALGAFLAFVMAVLIVRPVVTASSPEVVAVLH